MVERLNTFGKAVKDRYPSQVLTDAQKAQHIEEVINTCDEAIVLEAAYRAHDLYMQSRNGQPRLKPVIYDQAWITAHGQQVDVANTDYPNLPTDHIYDILDSILVAKWAAGGVGLFLASINDPRAYEKARLEIVSGVVHEAFIYRRRFMGIEVDPSQQVPYRELADGVKEFDRFYARLGIAAYDALQKAG